MKVPVPLLCTRCSPPVSRRELSLQLHFCECDTLTETLKGHLVQCVLWCGLFHPHVWERIHVTFPARPLSWVREKWSETCSTWRMKQVQKRGRSGKWVWCSFRCTGHRFLTGYVSRQVWKLLPAAGEQMRVSSYYFIFFSLRSKLGQWLLCYYSSLENGRPDQIPYTLCLKKMCCEVYGRRFSKLFLGRFEEQTRSCYLCLKGWIQPLLARVLQRIRILPCIMCSFLPKFPREK